MKRARFASLMIAALLGGANPSRDAGAAAPGVLRVCADPNNLPFSNREGSGFENRLAQMLGRHWGVRVEYTWWAQRRGALRNTLKAGVCDVVMGVPTTLDAVATTKPYYSSSYMFVSKRERALDVSSFDDPRLRTLTIGVQIVGDDYANTPPVHALSSRGISDNVRGFSVLGDYAQAVPAAPILRAVANGDVDLAIVWGPLAGYLTRRDRAAWRVTPTPAHDGALPMRFEVGLGVRHADRELRERLNAFIARQKPSIDALLDSFGVPRP